MPVEAHLPLVDEILEARRAEIGKDFVAYKNHVYRMINFCFALRECNDDERTKIMIAGCFHDIGIWTGKTFDYLPPSVASASEYLRQTDREDFVVEIDLMIDQHHKLRPYHDARYPLVEVFRKGDLVDFSLGVFRGGLSRAQVKDVKLSFPNAGFHKRLVQLEAGWLIRHPLRPLPVLKW